MARGPFNGQMFQTGPVTEPSDQLDVDRPLPVVTGPAKWAKRGGAASAVLGAAMLAIGEILEPAKTNVEIAEPSDDRGDDRLNFNFGHLPDLD
jgi:hypothetical protein